MKKFLVISLLILLIAGSMLAGTLAYYTTSVELAAGSVVAKNFIFVQDGATTTFAKDAKIAPSETVAWDLVVMNFEAGAITETDLYYKLTFDVSATDGKEAIEPLVVTVKDSDRNTIETVTGTDIFDVYGAFPLQETDNNQQQEYEVKLHWPWGNADASDYAGDDFGTTVKVSAVAQQTPFGGQDPGGSPDPGEPPEGEGSGIHVLYKVINRWNQGGQDMFTYSITITNNTDKQIDSWQMTFWLPTDRITSVGMNIGKQEDDILGGKKYTLTSPPYDESIKIIPSGGGSITFTGNANGFGEEAIRDVKVNGENADLTCELAGS